MNARDEVAQILRGLLDEVNQQFAALLRDIPEDEVESKELILSFVRHMNAWQPPGVPPVTELE